MALENAQYVSQLNVANPLSTDTVSQADDHLRLIKSVLKNTFPNLNSAVTSTADQLNSPVPSGFIGMWSGAIAAIPTGWFLCDGTNGTPNLKDRFIVGAGDSYAVGAIGGAASVTLTESQIPSHSHVITAASSAAGGHNHSVNDPGHSHVTVNYIVPNSSPNPGFDSGSLYGSTSAFSGTGAATTGISLNGVGDHTHVITASAGNTGGGGSHENRPPYYALAYIMKA